MRTSREQDKIVCQMGHREKDLFLEVLGLYPRTLSGCSPLSRNSVVPDGEAAQRLLDEALTEQREQNRTLLQRLMLDLARFQVRPTGLKLVLSEADLEWILQVLNDVRVGSWVKLGSPENLDTLNFSPEDMTEETGPTIWAMEMSGYFQMHLLKALTGP